MKAVFALRFWAALLVCMPLGAAGWIRVESPNFQLYTTAGEARGLEIASFFEELRANFSRVFPAVRIERRVRILAFANHEEYKQYRVGNFASAYFLRRDNDDVIVLDSADESVLSISAHEFTHLVIEHAGWHLPAWMNEGLAEYYSSLARQGNKLAVGRPLESRLRMLDFAPPIQLQQMFSLGPNAIEYTERDKPGLFYAQSWLLIHMLKSDPRYQPRFEQLLSTVASGKDSATALTTVYGRSLAEIESDLKKYPQRVKSETMTLANAGVDAAAQSLSGQADEIGGQLAAADLLSMLGRGPQAELSIARTQEQFPKSWQVMQVRGRIALRSGDLAAARTHYGRAIAAGGNDPQLLLEYARMLREGPVDAGERTAALRKAAEANPELDEANLLPGLEAYRGGNYLEAVRYLQRLRRIEGPQAYLAYRALADSYWRLGHLAEALEAAGKAEPFAKDPDQRLALNRLREKISRPSAAPSASPSEPAEEDAGYVPRNPKTGQRAAPAGSALILHRKENLQTVEGMLVHFECKVPALTVRTSSGNLTLTVDDPSMVSVRGGASPKLDFTCGSQSPRAVRAEFVEQNGRKLVRSIELK